MEEPGVEQHWFRGVYLADAVKRDWHILLHLQYGAASFGGIAGETGLTVAVQ